MTVVLHLRGDTKCHLDRRYRLDEVAKKVNEGRESGKLIQFETDLTPTGQMIWIDPSEVTFIHRES
jgi:hypothetical protein